MGYIEKTYGRSEKFLAFKVCFYDTLVPTREYKSGYAADRFAAIGVSPREDARITDTMYLFKWFMGKRKRYKLVDAADHIGYEWTGRAHGSLADALATLAVQRWLEQWLVAE